MTTSAIEANARYRDHHREPVFSPAYIASIYADADAAEARFQSRLAAQNAILAADARNPLRAVPIDPTAGGVRRTFYETMRLKGE